MESLKQRIKALLSACKPFLLDTLFPAVRFSNMNAHKEVPRGGAKFSARRSTSCSFEGVVVTPSEALLTLRVDLNARHAPRDDKGDIERLGASAGLVFATPKPLFL